MIEILKTKTAMPTATKEKKSTTRKTTKKEDWTLITAIEKIWTEAHDSELTTQFFKKIAKPAEYIKSILNITPMQCVILSTLADSEDGLTYRNIAHFTKTTRLKMMLYENEYNDLVARKFVTKGSTWDHGEQRICYTIRPEALDAIKNNTAFVAPNPSNYSPKKFAKEVSSQIEALSVDNSKCEETIDELQGLVNDTTHLEISKFIKNLKFKQKDTYFLFFFILFKHLIVNHERYISKNDFEDYFPDDDIYVDLFFEDLENQRGILFSENIIENQIVDGMVVPTSFGFTDDTISTVLKEFNVLTKNNIVNNLISADKIDPKELYYNKREEGQVETLKELISEEKYNEIRDRLKKTNFRIGFASLFYGGPGTGKTETVLQLAKATGRSIMQVNISEVKSKWVGDSEKNIQAIFNQYRRAVSMAEKNGEKVPILLFNEADAIISRRKEGATNAVDKMENSIQNIILQEMEKLEGILIATTNLTENLDPAFERRFLYKIRFDKPEVEVKVKIWKSMIGDISDNEALSLASKYDFSGGQIENIARKVTINNILYGTAPEMDSLQKLCNEEVIAKETSRQRIGFGH